MRFREIAPSIAPLSEVGFGVWSVATTWWGIKDKEVGIRLLREAKELGVNFFDTANVYGQGLGETVLQEAFGDDIKEIIIGTKFGYDFEEGVVRTGHGELPQDWSPEFIRKTCESSLRRLGRDWIDIYQLHNPRIEAVQSTEILETLKALQKEGKILEYAAALGPDIGWAEEGHAAMNEGGYKILQVIYSLLEQDPTSELIPTAEKTGAKFIVRVPHASGLLDGSYNPQKHFDKSDHRSHRKDLWMQAGIEGVELLKGVLSKERSLAESAILFCLAASPVVTVLPNFTRSEQIKTFTAAVEKSRFSKTELEKVFTLWENTLAAKLDQPFADSRSKPTPKAA